MENKISVVSVKEKKEFIRWFLKNYKVKRRECVWILEYLRTHETLLANVKFVDNAHEQKRAMVITTTCDESIPFRFFKGNLMSADAEKAFHDMRLHPDEPMYIQLNYSGKNKCPEYMKVDEAYNSNDNLSPAVLEEAEKIMVDLHRQMLLRAIDTALDKGDQKLFMELWEQLNEVGVGYSFVN